MTPNFKTAKELEYYCSGMECKNCLLYVDCVNIEPGDRGIDTVNVKCEKLFIHYRKKKIKKLLS